MRFYWVCWPCSTLVSRPNSLDMPFPLIRTCYLWKALPKCGFSLLPVSFSFVKVTRSQLPVSECYCSTFYVPRFLGVLVSQVVQQARLLLLVLQPHPDNEPGSPTAEPGTHLESSEARLLFDPKDQEPGRRLEGVSGGLWTKGHFQDGSGWRRGSVPPGQLAFKAKIGQHFK